jgi:hypothetical protein
MSPWGLTIKPWDTKCPKCRRDAPTLYIENHGMCEWCAEEEYEKLFKKNDDEVDETLDEEDAAVGEIPAAHSPSISIDVSGGNARRGFLLSHIREHILETGRHIREPDQKFHPSDLARKFCPRAWALLNYHRDGPRTKAAAVDLDTARAFARGKEIHERTLAAFRKTGALWGRYVHLGSRREHIGFPPKGRGWSYQEVPLRHDEDRIVGYADGLIRLNGKKYGVEIKSISEYGYKNLGDHPREDHLHQVLVYLHCLHWMAEQKRRQNTPFPGGFVDEFDKQALEGFIILYENKADQRVKEYVVRCSASEVAKFMTYLRGLMREALEIERTGSFPECRCQPGDCSVLCREISNPGRITPPPSRVRVAVPVVAPTPAIQGRSPALPDRRSRRAASQPAAPNELGSFVVGTRVRHPYHGVGLIKAVAPHGSDILVSISFDGKESRKFLAEKAGLERL